VDALIAEIEERFRDLLLMVTEPLPDKPQGAVFVAGLIASDIVFIPLRKVFG